MRSLARAAPATLMLGAILLAWEAAGRVFGLPAYVLPTPSRVVGTIVARFGILAPEALVTASETVIGLVAGTAAGLALALVMAWAPPLARALGPLMVASQALPVLALAPILVIWLGFGLASKVAMAGLTIFFTVAASFHEGLRRTDPGLIDLARLYGATPGRMLRLIRVPAALPSLAAGFRIAATFAPTAALIGEWVGSSRGLGLLMLQANARMQTDMVFAAVAFLVLFSLLLWGASGLLVRRVLRWAPDTLR